MADSKPRESTPGWTALAVGFGLIGLGILAWSASLPPDDSPSTPRIARVARPERPPAVRPPAPPPSAPPATHAPPASAAASRTSACAPRARPRPRCAGELRLVSEVCADVELPGQWAPSSITFSRDSRLVAIAGPHGVDVYEVATGRRVLGAPPDGYSAPLVQRLAGGQLVSATVDYSSTGALLVHDLPSGRQRVKLPHRQWSPFTKVVLSDDGLRLGVARGGGQDGKRYVSVYDVATGSLRSKTGWSIGRDARGMPEGFSPDFSAVAFSGEPGSVLEVRDAVSGRLIRSLQHTDMADHLVWRRDDRLAIAHLNGDGQLWNYKTGEVLRVVKAARPRTARVWDDGRTLICTERFDDGEGRAVTFFDLETGAARVIGKIPGPGFASGLALSPDGTVLAETGAEKDRQTTTTFWEIKR